MNSSAVRRILPSEAAVLGSSFRLTGWCIVGEIFAPEVASQFCDALGALSASSAWLRSENVAPLSYAFDRFPVSNVGPTELEQWRSAHRSTTGASAATAHGARTAALGAFADELNSSETCALIESISGCGAAPGATVAFASRFMTGDHLGPHEDAGPHDGRCLAFVYGLTRGWNESWGGQTRLHGSPDVDLLPDYNSLLVFAVPRGHCVRPVASSCTAERLAISGWFTGGSR